MKIDFEKLNDEAKAKLVEARWSSSSELWDTVDKVYKRNTAIYSNKADWLDSIPQKRKPYTVQANRIFVNMESVINALIANPPGVNILPSRDGEAAQDFARKLESFFRKKYLDLNVKETMRMGYRNLYFGRLMVIKPFWNPIINDFDFRVVDPRNVRFGKYARKEQDSEFAIEEIDDNLCALVERFPKKKTELMKKYGFANDENGLNEMYIKNPEVKYKEAWVGDYVIFKLGDIILDCIKNPYWDWDGILITDEEEQELGKLEGDGRRDKMQEIKIDQDSRKQSYIQQQLGEQTQAEGETSAPEAIMDTQINQNTAEMTKYKPYFFNYFDKPRKPYIFATIFNNENSPIGRTDMITLSAELQKGIDKRKMDIDENCELVNGIIKIDASVMGKSDAQRIRWETKGIIWGKGVAAGVSRETGTGLPQMVFDDMIDSRQEIDNIMAASSAFRGERQGQETKAGRLALIQQSQLRLNEMVQLGDFVAKEIFDWGMQLAKTRYTEYHYAKWMGKEGAREVIELIQDDFEDGSEVRIIAGKTLPVDDEFKFEQAQIDFEKGALGLKDYLEIENYDNASELAKNAVIWSMNPPVAVGLSEEEMQKVAPPQQEEKPPSVSINYTDIPPDAKVQLLEKIGIQTDPALVMAKDIADNESKKADFELKKESQMHGQRMSERNQMMAEKSATEKEPSK